jgi:hypothetical protein
MASFDFFVAEMKCPSCGKVSPRDASTNMQTKLRDEPELASFGVGDRFDFDLKAVEESGYRKIQDVAHGDPIRILQPWECPWCGRAFNWAMIEIARTPSGMPIARIDPVVLDRATLESAHFISEEALYVLEQLEGRKVENPRDTDIVKALRRQLKR